MVEILAAAATQPADVIPLDVITRVEGMYYHMFAVIVAILLAAVGIIAGLQIWQRISFKRDEAKRNEQFAKIERTFQEIATTFEATQVGTMRGKAILFRRIATFEKSAGNIATAALTFFQSIVCAMAAHDDDMVLSAVGDLLDLLQDESARQECRIVADGLTELVDDLRKYQFKGGMPDKVKELIALVSEVPGVGGESGQ